MKKSEIFTIKGHTYLIPFSFSVFLSAFLLFQVQPIISKYILPWFGGSSSVWITAMLFFQVLLLFGYLYAFLLTKLSFKRQIFLHAIILSIITGVLFLLFFIWQSPITPPLSYKPDETMPPVLQVISILLISVGLPYFILSTTSSLLQRWYSQVTTASPYRLYALSNAGSLLGIILYPFFIEIFLPLHLQGIFWAIGFLLYAFMLLFIARMTGVHSKKNTAKVSENKLTEKIISTKTFLWIFLPFLSSLLLLATTTKITQAVAPVPFLWLVPLGLYLLSFILCFDSNKWYWRWFYPVAFLVSAVAAVMITLELYSAARNFTVYAVFLFSTFMLLHGELYRIKPEPERLTAYYLFISIGGAIGGIFVGILAPLIFTDYWELYIGIFLTSLVALSVIATFIRVFVRRFESKSPIAKIPENIYFLLLGIGLLFITWNFLNEQALNDQTIKKVRNFYGTISISHEDDMYGKLLTLYNGEISHGSQYIDEALRKSPTTYYGEVTGSGLAIQRHRNYLTGNPIHIGVVGLGVGTLATYGRVGDTITFYEINPAVIEVAREDFTYLSDSEAEVDVIFGDARLSMEKEVGEKIYDVLLIDAFTDDAIPVHLLTKESFSTYLDLLDSEYGILAIHISNRYLDLKPVILQAANYYNLSTALIESSDTDYQVSSATWVLLSKNQKALSDPEIQNAQSEFDTEKRVDLWTDDYSNLFQVLDLEW